MKHSNKHPSNTGRASLKSPTRRRTWNIAEKKYLVAEAKEKGIQAIAQDYDIPRSALLLWMQQDFSDTPSTNKRKSGAGRPLL